MSNTSTRLTRQDVEDWLEIEDLKQLLKEQTARNKAFLGLQVMSPTGSIEITEANIGQLLNS